MITVSGVPCALSPREHTALATLARGRRVVEAGALLGGSTITLASTARHVISIDRHSGYSGETWRRYRSNLGRAGVASRVNAWRGEVLALLPLAPADVAFVDLTGDYALTLAAFRATLAPILAVHDCERAYCPGVARAIADSGFTPFGQIDTLALLAKKEPSV